MYRLMEAWRDNKEIDFNFYDAHDLFISRDSSQRETIKRNLRERLKNAKQAVLIGTPTAKSKGGDGYSFLAHEISVIMDFNLPILIANKNGSRSIDYANIPKPLIDNNYYTISTSFQPTIIKFALDEYTPFFHSDKSITGPHFYKDEIYTNLGLDK